MGSDSYGPDRYAYGWTDTDRAGKQAQRGLDEAVVREISRVKGEPAWMLERRLEAWEIFRGSSLPSWGADLSGVRFDEIKYFVRPTERQVNTWEDLPQDIRRTYDRIGLPEAERRSLIAGVLAQYESEVVYRRVQEDLTRQGVVFLDTDTGLREQPELFEEYFGTVVSAEDSIFTALNTAVWSGGTLVYVPPGVHVDIPLQAYFRINTENMGQFERILLVADEGSFVHYVEGCTAPIRSSSSLHASVAEIIVKKDARVRCTTIQNWSENVHNAVTKRAVAHEGATVEWVEGNIGSKATMKYPTVILAGRGAKAEAVSLSFAGSGRHLDTGAKMIHEAPGTSSSIVARSVVRGGGRATYRGLVRMREGADGAAASVRCDTLLTDDVSRAGTYPHADVRTDGAQLGHEATATRIGEEQIFYLMSRGLSEAEAMALIVRGFIEPVARALPMEYAVELNRLIDLELQGAVG